MAYDMYIDGVLFPVMPEKIEIKSKSQNKTVSLINDGEVSVIKAEGLKEISFNVLLPNVRYPMARYEKGFQKASYYVAILQKLKDEKKSFQWILSRASPGKKNLGNTDIKCTLEDYTIREDAGEGVDWIASVKLKEYKEYSTKTVQIQIQQARRVAAVQAVRPVSDNAPVTGQSYTVVSGDCLYNIARRFYGNGGLWSKIYDANRAVIGGNPNLIYPGQVYTIP